MHPAEVGRTGHSALAQQAVASLLAAASSGLAAATPQVEESAVYQPDSWLLQKCWEALADAGAAEEMLEVVGLAAPRQPLARFQGLHRLSRQLDRRIGLAWRIAQELERAKPALLSASRQDRAGSERLLYAASTAAAIGEPQQAFALLEALDQWPGAWDRPAVVPEQRQLLAETIVRLGPHPLTKALIQNALRRHDDAGAQLILAVATAASLQLRRHPSSAPLARLLEIGADTLRNATLTSLQARRVAAIVFGQVGASDDLLAQLTTIANIQAARRESGLARQGEQTLLRQVKRPAANSEVDFQVYTLQEAVRSMPVRQLPREARIELADRLALLGTQSDGWTAASAAATLIELGAVKYAVQVVEAIPANDPTKAEGYLSLVRGLLELEEPAQEPIQQALAWAADSPRRNPGRALVWGIAELFLNRRSPAQALAVLDAWQEPAGFWQNLRAAWGHKANDDDLRRSGLRLRALLQQDPPHSREIQQQINLLTQWAPQLLAGEALASFLTDNLLAPLLESGRIRQALPVLPWMQQATATSSGEKYAARLSHLAGLLVAKVEPTQTKEMQGEVETVRGELERWMGAIWQADSQRGLWQTVHGIEGLLPLLIGLEGPQAVVQLAHNIVEIGPQWGGGRAQSAASRPAAAL